MTDKVSAERQSVLEAFNDWMNGIVSDDISESLELEKHKETIRAALSQPELKVVTVEECLRRALAMTSTDHQDPVAFHICRALDYIEGYKKDIKS